MKILYKFPSRSRPDKFFACLDNITSMAMHDDYKILCSLDSDDESMNNAEVITRLTKYPKVQAVYGYSTGKIYAINRDMEIAGDWDILITESDDFEFIKPGFDVDIINDFKKHFPDNRPGLIHYPDGHVNERLITMAIMNRAAYELDGFIYNPCYTSLYADNEQMIVAKQRGLYVYINERKFTHKNAVWGYGEPDELLKYTESFYDSDGEIFRDRERINFGLPA